MPHSYGTLFALPAVVVVLACGGNPPSGTPGVEGAEAEAPVSMTGSLSDERAMELGRGYAEQVYARDFEGLWESMSEGARQDFGTLERFRDRGDRIVSELGSEISVVGERIEPARAGMRASKLYFRISEYTGAEGGRVRLLIGLMTDGSIAGMQVRPVE